MRVLVYNDTSEYHYGCKEVMSYLYDELKSAGHELSDSFSQCDAIVVNGEGTMHDRQNTAVVILDVMARALRMNKKVALVNSVFQNMDLTDTEVETLKNSYVSVREVKSQQHLAEYGIEADVHLDFSYWRNPIFEKKTIDTELVCGEMFFRPPYRQKQDFKRVNIFNDTWIETIDTIRSAEWFITGRHHEMYAACIAETPFVVLQGNTWKNEGLLETAGVNIPTVHGYSMDDIVDECWQECKVAEANGEYEKLFEFMRNQPRFTFKDIL